MKQIRWQRGRRTDKGLAFGIRRVPHYSWDDLIGYYWHFEFGSYYIITYARKF